MYISFISLSISHVDWLEEEEDEKTTGILLAFYSNQYAYFFIHVIYTFWCCDSFNALNETMAFYIYINIFEELHFIEKILYMTAANEFENISWIFMMMYDGYFYNM